MGTGRNVLQSQQRFAQIPGSQIQRSQFNRSHGLKTTLDEGDLVPVYVDEVLPGDTFKMRPTFFGRCATLIHPIMDNVYLDCFFFAVPVRLIWDNWQKFHGEQDNPGDSTSFTVPQVVSPATTGFANGTLFDYLGVPTKVGTMSVNALHSRAYNLIYNEWFRSEDLVNSLVVDKDDGPDDPADYVIVKRAKRHDYFTSALPFLQKATAVSLPLGTTAPLQTTGDGEPTFDMVGATNTKLEAATGSGDVSSVTAPSSLDQLAWNDPKLEVDLATATAATINELRESFQLQRLYERDARGGTRYTEIIRSHFGVVSPDQRLQRPEYLGGGSTRLSVTPVENNTQLTIEVGNLAAYGIFVDQSGGFTKTFDEHCVLLGLVSIRADLNYQQGLERMWSRQTRFDFYYPALAHLGEQAVLNQEIFAQGDADPTADAAVFGYQERFAEYRYKPSRVTSQMRSNDATSLDVWHLSQDFSALPVLNASFIEEAPPISRIIAIVAEPHFLLDCYFDLVCARPMPVYSVPGLIDHF